MEYGKTAALFFDIDGTLVSEKTRTIPDSTRQAIAAARKNGHRIFINSGRTFCEIDPSVKALSPDGYLCACGSCIIYKDKLLLQKILPFEKGIHYIDEMLSCRIDAMIEGVDDVYFPRSTSRFSILERERLYLNSIGLGKKTYIEDKNFKYCKLYFAADSKSSKEKFKEAVSEDFDIIDRRNNAYECIPKGYSKATALDFICSYLSLKPNNIYVFGDSVNDLDVFQHAAHTIAMGEHADVLEPYTEYITDTVENDGIYKAIKHCGLI